MVRNSNPRNPFGFIRFREACTWTSGPFSAKTTMDRNSDYGPKQLLCGLFTFVCPTDAVPISAALAFRLSLLAVDAQEPVDIRSIHVIHRWPRVPSSLSLLGCSRDISRSNVAPSIPFDKIPQAIRIMPPGSSTPRERHSRNHAPIIHQRALDMRPPAQLQRRPNPDRKNTVHP
jgi:hypothetical protein